MSLTQEQIKKISENLSKISISEEIEWDINNILNYMDLLNEVDTTWVEPTVSVVEKDNILRKDIEIEKDVEPKKLLECSSLKIVANQIAVSNIMK